MLSIVIDKTKISGRMKPMNAVNNGPIMPARMFSKSGNFDDYKAACIPFARNHDASFCANYGGERTVDINAIFPNFDADPYDPASYDFACTDHYTKNIMDAGTQVFYRLGNKIDHRIKKYDSVPPSDFNKWAVICEHIIAHYNEGWADGFHYNITYWEIWNEPDNSPECWAGSYEDFLKLFEITAKHLKSKFPSVKVGGPAFATGGIDNRKDDFLRYMKEHDVPIDFFSWHTYRSEVSEYTKRMMAVRESLDKAGYTETESILNEWAYVINWHDRLRESKLAIIGMKGAAFVASVMIAGQNFPLDMLMYYDARPSSLNCLFDFYTYDKLKGYYPFYMFSELTKLGKQIEAKSSENDIYVTAASDGCNSAAMLSYFTNDENAKDKEIEITLKGNDCGWKIILLDETHNAEYIGDLLVQDDKAKIKMSPNTVILLESFQM